MFFVKIYDILTTLIYDEGIFKTEPQFPATIHNGPKNDHYIACIFRTAH
jgi:hypothetical protein